MKAKPSPKRGALLYVEWVDAQGHEPGWKDLDAVLESNLVVCHAVGWVIEETADKLILVADWNANGSYDREATIASNAIKRRVELRVRK